ncbi:hypothetical protein B4Q13_17805, partial [Lacticaseibacillus rhamnosus]
ESASFKIPDGDAGHTLRVVVTATNVAGSAEKESATTSEVIGNGPSDSEAPKITGEAKEGQLLTASSGKWSGTEPITYEYEWLRCNTGGAECKQAQAASVLPTYTVAAALGGSGFISAFVAGAVFGGLVPRESEEASLLSEELGEILGGVTFLIFGAVLLGPALEQLSWRVALYAVLSLTVIRMVPVGLAMLGTHARPATVSFLGWFGPRGLASIVFAVIAVEELVLLGKNRSPLPDTFHGLTDTEQRYRKR